VLKCPVIACPGIEGSDAALSAVKILEDKKQS
jgi:hypothetical protein